MTARRGSLSYKIVRLAQARRWREARASKRFRWARIGALLIGRSLMALAALCLTLAVGAQVYRVAMRDLALHRQIVQMDRENAALQATNDRLAARVQRLHDPEYLVPLIHEQLGLTKPNEVFIEVTPSTPAPQAPR